MELTDVEPPKESYMKNTIQILLGFLIVILSFACNPQDSDDHSLGAIVPIANEDVSFSKQISSKSKNVIEFINTTNSKTPYAILWDFGNNVTSKDKIATASYPYAGKYIVTLSLYTADGSIATRTEEVIIESDDPTLLSSDTFIFLTGGTSKQNGTTWVIDQYNNFTTEVKEKTGLAISGHMGLGPIDGYSQEWWGASPNAKSDWSLYSSKFTFIQNGLKLNISNQGVGYGRAATYTKGGYTLIEQKGDDAILKYKGGSYTFDITEGGKYPILKLSGDAFLGYYCGTQEYEIIYQTSDVMALRQANTIEGQDWILVYCREELNVGKRPATKELKEDFESTQLAINFEPSNLGPRTGVVDNYLAYDNLNTSLKAFAYEKVNSQGVISYTATDYTFDLKNQNQIKLQVLIPQATITSGSEAKITVKLQDSTGVASEAVREVTLNNTDLDKWSEIEFDFSAWSTNQSYDKLIILCGGNNNSKGMFYLDNFQFINN